MAKKEVKVKAHARRTKSGQVRVKDLKSRGFYE